MSIFVLQRIDAPACRRKFANNGRISAPPVQSERSRRRKFISNKTFLCYNHIMESKKKLAKSISVFVIVSLSIAVMLSFVKSIFVSFDIDEGYALAQSYRLALGDTLFGTMWEPHQLSAYLSAFFIKIFMAVTKNTEGIAIFMRIIGCALHLFVAYVLYRALKKLVNSEFAVILSLIHCLFLPKLIQIPEFELMSYWFMILSFSFFVFTFKNVKHNILYICLAGIFTLLQMTSYPTLCILFPIGIVLIARISDNKKSDILTYCLSYIGAGIIVLILIFSKIDFNEFTRNLSYIFMDESHTTKIGSFKYLELSLQLLHIFLYDLIYFASSLAICFLIFFVKLYKSKKESVQNSKSLHPESSHFNGAIQTVFVCALLLTSTGLLIDNIVRVCFLDQNVYLFTYYYLPLTALSFVSAAKCKNDDGRLVFYGLLIPSILSIVGIFTLTNMTVLTTLTHLFPIFFAVALFTFNNTSLRHSNEDENNVKSTVFNLKNKMPKVLTVVLLSTLSFSLLFSRLVAIRVNGCLPVTIKAGMERIEKGPLKNIYVLDDDIKRFDSMMNLLDNYSEPEEKLLYIGGENWIYLYNNYRVSGASTQGTSSYNKAFLDYMDIYYEKCPDVILYDKQVTSNPVYSTSKVSDEFFKWLNEDSCYKVLEETDDLVIYRSFK